MNSENDRNEDRSKSESESRNPTDGASKNRPNRPEDTHDPEFEIPDTEQVERDREQAEKEYREPANKKPAA